MPYRLKCPSCGTIEQPGTRWKPGQTRVFHCRFCREAEHIQAMQLEQSAAGGDTWLPVEIPELTPESLEDIMGAGDFHAMLRETGGRAERTTADVSERTTEDIVIAVK